MGIKADEQNKLFTLETNNTMYQLKADKYGMLKHIWYGERTECDMEYLLKYHDAGFSGNTYETILDRTYSPDTMPLEYPCGNCDYRIPAVSVINADGTGVVDLRYNGYKISSGKYSIPGLPAVYADEQKAQTLEIYLKDPVSNICVTLKYAVIPEYDIITESAVIMNKGTKTVYLEKAASLCLDNVNFNGPEWIHFHGRHAKERIPERRALIHGVQKASSTRGASSHQQNPAVIICSKDCSETEGECIGAMLVYSGSFSAEIEYSQLDQTRLVIGINQDMFRWKLDAGDVFYTPEAILSYSGKGLEKLSHNFHKIIRNNICRGKYKLAKRPVLINNWEATYFDFNEQKLLSIAEEAAKLGIDMLVMDDGWFGKRDSDNSGLGDWTVNTAKLKGGLSFLSGKLKENGIKLGIWFEPEMISEDSDLFRSHPDYMIRIPQRKPNPSRHQFVLDMTRKDVREHLYNAISGILKSADISYVKWDCNRSICDWYSAEIPAERMGEMPHRYMLGLYELLERLTTDFPDVLFEGCSGGGGRFDAGMLYYCPQIWCSDNTDAFERTQIQYGTSFFYPVSAMGAHISAVPNHQTGRITSVSARAVTAMAGCFGCELDIGKLTENEKAAIADYVKKYKESELLIHNGDYYRLSDPFAENIAAWSFVSEDKENVIVQGMLFRTETNMKRRALKLRGLDTASRYKINDSEESYTGAALMHGGILLPASWGDYFPFEFYLKRQ